jgi:sulfite exporter TauE/SafE
LACARKHRSAPLRYQLGRTLGYTLAGFASGQLGHVLGQALRSRVASVVFALLSAAACLIVAHGFMRSRASNAVGQSGATGPLIALRTTLPRSRSRSLLRSLTSLLPGEPLALGALSALLPCGVLGAALLAAVATADGAGGALLMLGFVSTSGVALVVASVLSRYARNTSLFSRRLAAVALVVVAGLSLAAPLRALFSVPQAAPTGVDAAPLCH